jgi:hypothetical protein
MVSSEVTGTLQSLYRDAEVVDAIHISQRKVDGEPVKSFHDSRTADIAAVQERTDLLAVKDLDRLAGVSEVVVGVRKKANAHIAEGDDSRWWLNTQPDSLGPQFPY